MSNHRQSTANDQSRWPWLALRLPLSFYCDRNVIRQLFSLGAVGGMIVYLSLRYVCKLASGDVLSFLFSLAHRQSMHAHVSVTNHRNDCEWISEYLVWKHKQTNEALLSNCSKSFWQRAIAWHNRRAAPLSFGAVLCSPSSSFVSPTLSSPFFSVLCFLWDHNAMCNIREVNQFPAFSVCLVD